MQPGSTAWIYVDLGSPRPIGEVRLNWETAYAVDYQIQVSNDAQSWSTVATIEGNATKGVHATDGLSAFARYVRVYCAKTSAFSDNYSLYGFQVFADSAPDLALRRPGQSSKIEGPGYQPGNALDGDGATRWSSGQWIQAGSTAWISVDLGATRSIGQARLNWETAYGVDYQIQASLDDQTWTTIVDVRGNGRAGVLDYTGLGATGRYLRVFATRTSLLNDNYSLYSLSVYA